MATLSESLQNKGSDLIYDYSCYFCEENSVNTEADYYCAKCVKCFCNSCIIQHKTIFKNHSVLGKENTKQWPMKRSTLECLQRCQDHQDETIKLFCKDHNQLCCHTCIALHHRQCDKVLLLADAAKNCTTTDLHLLRANISTMKSRLQKLHEETELNMHALHESYLKTKEEVYAFRKKINDALDELEKISLKELEDSMGKLKESLQADVDRCKSMREQLNRMVEAINDVNEDSDLFFIAQAKCSEILKLSDGLLAEKCLAFHRNLIFHCDPDIEEYLTKTKYLGWVAINDQPFSIKRKSQNNVKVTDDTKACSISGILSLPNNQILVADKSNSRVKLLNQHYQVVSHCDLPSSPWDLCRINTSNEWAVTVTDVEIQTIQFLKMNNGQLVKGTKIQPPHQCIGIANHREALYVTSGTALYHYTIKGKLVKKPYEDTTDNDDTYGYTVYKCDVNSSGDKIYITNAARDTLLTLSIDGTVLSTFSDLELRFPIGVHVTEGDQVLVCGNISHNVIQVDSEGKKKIATLASRKDGITSPVAVHYNRHTCSVIIGFDDKNEILRLIVE